MNVHAHDAYTTLNLKILVIVKIKHFPYLGKISPTRLIKTSRRISYIKRWCYIHHLENLEITSSSRIIKLVVIRTSLVKNITLEQ